MEKLRLTWNSEVRSSEGYRVRIIGRGTLRYRDPDGDLMLPGELLLGAAQRTFLIDAGAVPDTPQRPRRKVLRNIRAAFEHARWVLLVDRSDLE